MIIHESIGSRASRCLWAAEEIGIACHGNPITTLDGSHRTARVARLDRALSRSSGACEGRRAGNGAEAGSRTLIDRTDSRRRRARVIRRPQDERAVR